MPRRGMRSVLLVATCVVACRAERATPHVQSGPAASPGVEDRGALCLDVGEVRACWGDRTEDQTCHGGACLVRRPLPDTPPPSGFRCEGQRSARTCVTRASNGAPFACRADRCVQSPVRAPDDGEWECIEMAGAVVCRSLSEAAGVPSGALDAAFVCGVRMGHGERICVDFSPDTPPGDASWGCRVTYDSGSAARVCAPSNELRVGGRCTSRDACPIATACVGGRCLPDRPSPECWFDQDCGQSRSCRYGSCRAPG